MVLTSSRHGWLCIVSPTVALGVPPRAPGPVEEGLAVQLQGLALLPEGGGAGGPAPAPPKHRALQKAGERGCGHRLPQPHDVLGRGF